MSNRSLWNWRNVGGQALDAFIPGNAYNPYRQQFNPTTTRVGLIGIGANMAGIPGGASLTGLMAKTGLMGQGTRTGLQNEAITDQVSKQMWHSGQQFGRELSQTHRPQVEAPSNHDMLGSTGFGTPQVGGWQDHTALPMPVSGLSSLGGVNWTPNNTDAWQRNEARMNQGLANFTVPGPTMRMPTEGRTGSYGTRGANAFASSNLAPDFGSGFSMGNGGVGGISGGERVTGFNFLGKAVK